MFPYTFVPYQTYRVPSYASPDSEYLRALAEEEAAQQAYTDALRAQEDARARAEQARRARQAYEYQHKQRNSYLSDEDEDLDHGLGYGYAPRTRRPSRYYYPEHAILAEQRRREIEQQRRSEMIELERARERERIRQLEEEQRRRIIEEEKRKRMMLEEELRRQHEAEEREQAEIKRRLHEEYLRRQSLSPLEQLLGLRPSRSMSSSRREYATSPPAQRCEPSPISIPQTSARQDSTSSQSPILEGIHIGSPPPSTTPQQKRTSSPVPAPSPSPAPTQEPAYARSPSPTPKQIEAAEKIQATWREHAQRLKAHESITRISTAFESAKASFTLPTNLDFQYGSNINKHISLPIDVADVAAFMHFDIDMLPPVPKLAYTPNNAPVHVYEEELNRLLTQLDAVQSGGHVDIRNRRRELARRIEREAERIEKLKVAVFKSWQEKQNAEKKQEEATEEMAVDEAKGEEAVPAATQWSVPEVTITPAEPLVPATMDVDQSEQHSSDPSEPAPTVEEPSEPVFVAEEGPSKLQPELEKMDADEESKEKEADKTTVSVPSESTEGAIIAKPIESSFSTTAHTPERTSTPPPLADSASDAGTKPSPRPPALENGQLHRPVSIPIHVHVDESKDVSMQDVASEPQSQLQSQPQPQPEPQPQPQSQSQPQPQSKPLYDQDWDDVADEFDFF